MPRLKTDLQAMEPLTVRFPKEVLTILRQSAQENDRSLNAEIVNAVRSRVQTYKAQKQTPGATHA